MKVINLTAHTVTDTLTGKSYPPSGKVFRIDVEKSLISKKNDFNIYQYKYTISQKIPPLKDNTMYIVSNMALNVIPKDRLDIVSLGPVHRDEHGKTIGCRGFRR